MATVLFNIHHSSSQLYYNNYDLWVAYCNTKKKVYQTVAMCVDNYINHEDDKPIAKYLLKYENNYRESNSLMKRDEGKCAGTGDFSFSKPLIQTSY